MLQRKFFDPLARKNVPELEDVLRIKEQTLSVVPNSALIMARWPELTRAYRQLGSCSVTWWKLVFLMASLAGGCRYCHAHTVYVGQRFGIPEEKLDHIWTFESSGRFSSPERAALRLAMAGGTHPPMVTDQHFEDLCLHYDDEALVEIVGVSAFAGFMNRYNEAYIHWLCSAQLHGQHTWMIERVMPIPPGRLFATDESLTTWRNLCEDEVGSTSTASDAWKEKEAVMATVTKNGPIARDSEAKQNQSS